MKKENQLVEEIHNAFNNAGDTLLKEASEIIGNIGHHTVNKADRLKKIGFNLSQEVRAVESVKVTREVAERVSYYQQKYPLNKFITEEQVVKICKKYNLTCAPVSRYKGFVPETKLKQIENFTLGREDVAPALITNPKFSFKYSQSDEIKALKQKYPNGLYPAIGISSISIEGVFVESYERVQNQSLLICAPAKDMDLKGLKKIGSFLLSTFTVTVPDPVVLQPCKGGYLILAAWGDEASDEIVVNQINN